MASYGPLVGVEHAQSSPPAGPTGDHDREKGQKPGTRTERIHQPGPTSRSTHCPGTANLCVAVRSLAIPDSVQSRPRVSPAFSVKSETVSLHSSSIAFALLIPALDCARSRRRHLTATPRLHRDYGALSFLHIALHHPLSLSLSAAIGTPDPQNLPSGPATVHRPSGAMGGAVAAATATATATAMATVATTASKPDDLQCCCGRQECAFLRHNCSVLLSVERDVHVAAKMGQVCCSAAHLHSLFATASRF